MYVCELAGTCITKAWVMRTLLCRERKIGWRGVECSLPILFISLTLADVRHHCRSWNGQALNADFSVLTTFKYHWVLSLTIITDYKWLQNSVEFEFEFESFCLIMKISKLKIIQLSISCTAKGNEIFMIW